MVYQLRFRKPDSIYAWLERMVRQLEEMVPKEDWGNHGSTSLGKRVSIRGVLWDGLMTFLCRHENCGKHPACDYGCIPAAENSNPDRYSDALVNAPVELYLLEGVDGLSEMTERLVQPFEKLLQGSQIGMAEVRRILMESLGYHLYENMICGKENFCRWSRAMDLRKELEDREREYAIEKGKGDYFKITLGRAAFSSIFLVSGVFDLLDWQALSSTLAEKELPAVPFLLGLAITVDFFGGLSLLMGWKPRWGALALILFLIPATLLFHDFWNFQGPARQGEALMFLRNLTFFGGLFIILGGGASRFSSKGGS